MAKLTLSAAVHVCNMTRTTIQRVVKTGRLSLDAEHRVDTAELLRVGYQLDAAALPAAAHQNAAGRSSLGTPVNTPRTRCLTTRAGLAHASGHHAAHDAPDHAAADAA
jgi:hypothetical protein